MPAFRTVVYVDVGPLRLPLVEAQVADGLPGTPLEKKEEYIHRVVWSRCAIL